MIRDQDTKQYITITVLVFIDMYRIITGSMLSLFVPQNCNELRDTDANATSADQMCTFEENLYEDLTDYNVFVNAWNFFTVFMFLVSYAWEFRRERFMVANFDDDDNKPTNWLVVHGPAKEVIWTQYLMIQKWYYRVVLALFVTYIVNCVLTGVLVFYMYYLDTKTTTTYLTSVLLLAQKLSHMRSVSKTDVPRSSYLVENVSFNAWDNSVTSNDESKATQERVAQAGTVNVVI
jgi:hypothetical protein